MPKKFEKNNDINSNLYDFTNMIMKKENEILKISKFKQSLYEDWKSEYISKEEYLEYKQKYEKDIERIKQNITILEKEKQKDEKQNKNTNSWINEFKEKKEITKLSRDVILELIDCIYIKNNGDIIIKFKFEDELKKYLEYIEESKKQSSMKAV